MTLPFRVSSSVPSGTWAKPVSGTNLPPFLMKTLPEGRTFSLPGGGGGGGVIVSRRVSVVSFPSGEVTSTASVRPPLDE